MSDELKRETLVVQASSSGFEGKNFAMIKLNGFQVTMEKNESGHYRGLHLVIFNPYKGVVTTAKVFDTYKSSKRVNEFTKGLELPDGHLVIAAVMDDAAKKLSHRARQWFEKLGSKKIQQLEYRQGWAFMVTKQSEKKDVDASENLADECEGVAWVTEIFQIAMEDEDKDEQEPVQETMEIRQAGDSDLKLSTLSLGTW